MLDPTMPPQYKYAVTDKNNTIKLITSNKKIASWYQFLFETERISEIPMARK